MRGSVNYHLFSDLCLMQRFARCLRLFNMFLLDKTDGEPSEVVLSPQNFEKKERNLVS